MLRCAERAAFAAARVPARHGSGRAKFSSRALSAHVGWAGCEGACRGLGPSGQRHRPVRPALHRPRHADVVSARQVGVSQPVMPAGPRPLMPDLAPVLTRNVADRSLGGALPALEPSRRIRFARSEKGDYRFAVFAPGGMAQARHQAPAGHRTAGAPGRCRHGGVRLSRLAMRHFAQWRSSRLPNQPAGA